MSALIISAILLSLIFLGVLRTAIWLIPGLFIGWYFELASAAWLSFFVASAIFSRNSDGVFDFREKEKPFWIGIFFLTGLGCGLILDPVPYWIYGVGSLFVFSCFQVFKVFRLPVSKVGVFPAWFRAIPITLVILCLALKYLTFDF